MKKSKYLAKQVTFALKQLESDNPVSEICPEMGTTEQTYIAERKDISVWGCRSKGTANSAGGES